MREREKIAVRILAFPRKAAHRIWKGPRHPMGGVTSISWGIWGESIFSICHILCVSYLKNQTRTAHRKCHLASHKEVFLWYKASENWNRRKTYWWTSCGLHKFYHDRYWWTSVYTSLVNHQFVNPRRCVFFHHTDLCGTGYVIYTRTSKCKYEVQTKRKKKEVDLPCP